MSGVTSQGITKARTAGREGDFDRQPSDCFSERCGDALECGVEVLDPDGWGGLEENFLELVEDVGCFVTDLFMLALKEVNVIILTLLKLVEKKFLDPVDSRDVKRRYLNIMELKKEVCGMKNRLIEILQRHL